MTFFSSRRKKPAAKKKARTRGRVDGNAFADRRSVPMPQPKTPLPKYVQDQLDAVMISASDTRKQLAFLRETRHQRPQEPVQVPVHLRQGEPLDDSYRIIDPRTGKPAIVSPEKRGDARGGILPARD